jgi:hypothetical protein
MKYKNIIHRAREAHARDCAIRMAAHVGWVFESRPELLPPAVRDFFCEPSAELILIPWGGGCLAGIETAVRETRCAALLLEPGATNAGLSTIYFTVVRCAGGKLLRHSALRLWANAEDTLFLVPDPDGDDLDACWFRVSERGIDPSEAPWTGPFDYGFGHADALVHATKPEWR